MCELFCLSSRIPTVATFSLHRFAARGGHDGRTVDGWGLVFYDGRDIRLYREPEPAGDSAWLRFIEGRKIPSAIVISHIRRATDGPVSLANTQPFVRELGGRMHCFAHNGRLPEIAALLSKCEHFRPVGETDSEIAFCALLEQLRPLWRKGAVPGLDDRLAIIAGFAAEIRELGPANFLYADGDAVFAHGDRRIQADSTIAPPGLWQLHRTCSVDRDTLARSGIVIANHESQELTLFASVPLSEEPWRPLGCGEIVAVRDGSVQRLAGRGPAIDPHQGGALQLPKNVSARRARRVRCLSSEPLRR
jgi:glutamine amidotransferase